jgi:AAA domain, putative AbiEii toxin, Type IV TA system
MKRLEVESFGPIKRADIELGDLTVLVGPQASGKSLFVQLLKAVEDAGAIRSDLKNYGFDWLHGSDRVADYCSLYFGGGLQYLVQPQTTIRRDGRPVDFKTVAKPGGRAAADETTFLVPAQRVLVLQDGWPKPFMGYSVGDPYCMRRFSDSLRFLMENGLGSSGEEPIFPRPRRLKGELQDVVDEAIYIGAKLVLETEGLRKRIMLAPRKGAPALPYSAWSAGQREFTPLLLGLYWLMPPAKTALRGNLDTVIIEEPEMGLHPKAIVSFGLLVLELLQRGYRVILSTHSPVILDLVWAIRELRQVRPKRAIKALAEIFGLEHPSWQILRILESALTKEYKTYFFDRKHRGVVTRDISSLDPSDADDDIAGWGGLSGFSGRIAQIVGEAISEETA